MVYYVSTTSYTNKNIAIIRDFGDDKMKRLLQSEF